MYYNTLAVLLASALNVTSRCRNNNNNNITVKPRIFVAVSYVNLVYVMNTFLFFVFILLMLNIIYNLYEKKHNNYLCGISYKNWGSRLRSHQ